MALEFYSESQSFSLSEEDAYLLSEAFGQQSRGFPVLSKLYENLYKDPWFDKTEACLLIHELLTILDRKGAEGNKALARVVVRFVLFLNRVHRENSHFGAASD